MIVDHSWSPNKPTLFNLTDKATKTVDKSVGAGITIPETGVAATVVGGRTKCWFHISPPGMYPLYYAIVGTTIHLSTYKLRLQAKLPPRTKVEQAESGVIYVFDTILRKYKGQTIPVPEERTDASVSGFLDVLIEATEEVYDQAGCPRVVTSISGGTDGILTAYLLQQIGADQICTCVGRDDNDFDPKNAAIYAQHLGLDYEFTKLSTDTDELQSLLEGTLRSIEMVDFSNVLMGMCNVLVRRFGDKYGRSWHFNADFADVVLGNDILTVGQYKKSRTEAGLEPSRKSWAEWRMSSGMHTLPTNTQIAKVFLEGGGNWRQVFYHPKVVDYLLSAPLELVPAAKDKVLYKALLKQVRPDVPWDFEKKIGYYTGAGIGKIRLENPVLSDNNIRSTFKQIKGV